MMWNRSAAHNPEYRWLQALLFLYKYQNHKYTRIKNNFIYIYIIILYSNRSNFIEMFSELAKSTLTYKKTKQY